MFIIVQASGKSISFDYRINDYQIIISACVIRPSQYYLLVPAMSK